LALPEVATEVEWAVKQDAGWGSSVELSLAPLRSTWTCGDAGWW
jgi:hypothetical protein